ncbi:MAG: hypothetical protein WD604_14520 [Balneolaceae bacterium]
MAQRKTIENPLPDVEIPSFYSPAYKEVFEKDRIPNLENDGQPSRFQTEVLRTINANREDLERLNKVKKTAMAYEGRNVGLTQVHDEAEETNKRIYRRSSELETKLHNYKNSLQEQIQSELTETAARNRHEHSIQSYMLNKLKDRPDRLSFVRQAIKAGDTNTVTAVTECPHYLSGLEPEDLKNLRNQFIAEKYPKQNLVIEKIGKLAEHVGRGYQATIHNLEVLDTPEVKQAIALREAAKKAKE